VVYRGSMSGQTSSSDVEGLETARKALIPNAMKEKMAKGQLCHALYVRMVTSIEVIHMAAAAGLDCVFIDLEHGMYGLDVASMLSCASLQVGITPMVRVPSPTSEWIARALDGGAQAIIVPHVQNAAEARNIVKIAKFAPLGERSVGAAMPITRYASLPMTYANTVANENTLVICMIETASALEQAEEIAAVPGVDMLHVGCNDLIADFGDTGNLDSAELFEALGQLNKIAEKVSASGRTIFIGLGGFQNRPDLTEKYAHAYPHICYATSVGDSMVLMTGIKEKTSRCRQVSAKVAEKR